MTHLTAQSEPIDAVVTWVDGNTPAHRRKRQAYMDQTLAPLHANAVNPHRWANNDEILFCLQSIDNHAPWTRTIWIVVDTTPPDIASLSAALRAKVRIVRHREIFDGFTAMLPTFNSLAIESMLWRIDGLSEQFIYFNDDVFLTAPLEPSDLFEGGAPVLRGKWVDYSDLADNPDVRRDPARFNHIMQMNAAQLVGYAATDVFSAAHVVHPMRRSRMAQLFDHHPDAFLNNMRHRFRDLSQFLPQGLHNHACIRADEAVIATAQDHLHIRSGLGHGRPLSETKGVLQRAYHADIKFLCVNDLPQLEQLIPDARDWLSQVVGGFPQLPRGTTALMKP